MKDKLHTESLISQERSGADPWLILQLEAYIERYYSEEEEQAGDWGMWLPPKPAAERIRYASSAGFDGSGSYGKSELERIVAQTDASFSETLLRWIDEAGLKDAQVYKRAHISRQHFSKIRSNPDYRPTKATALALAIALELDLEHTIDLIGRAGYALTGSSKFDLIVRYFIERGIYDIDTINDLLYEFDQPLLGGGL